MVISPAGVRLWIEPDGAAAQAVATATSCRDLPEGWRHVRTGAGRHGVTLACGAIRVTYQQAVGLFEYLREPILEDFSGSPEVHHVFAELLREMAEPQPGSRMIIVSLMQRCLVMLLRRHCASGRCQLPWLSALENPKLGRAIAAMLDRPEAPHTLESLAQTAGMSRSAFAQQFTAAFGHPAIAFLREIRLRRAARQLEVTDLAVKAVATAAGFRSRSYFWRAFKALYGVDPAHFRTKCRAILASRAGSDSAGPAANPTAIADLPRAARPACPPGRGGSRGETTGRAQSRHPRSALGGSAGQPASTAEAVCSGEPDGGRPRAQSADRLDRRVVIDG
jgi:AraC family transcriptional regulator, activator of mtrCDE